MEQPPKFSLGQEADMREVFKRLADKGTAESNIDDLPEIDRPKREDN